MIFGAGDYAASMRMPSAAIGERDAHDEVYPGHRWHAVMHTIVAAARANGLRCMDGPYAGYTDTAGLERACRIAQALGFDGKQCIHPAQLATVNAAFTPSDAEVAKAAAIVEAYDKAVERRSGRGHSRRPDDRRRQRPHGAYDARATAIDLDDVKSQLPLDGLLVVSVEQAIAAPFASRQLADLGARVIKIERPGVGDFARAYDHTVQGLASHFVWTNRSKESLTLDLKRPEARRRASAADRARRRVSPQPRARRHESPGIRVVGAARRSIRGW